MQAGKMGYPTESQEVAVPVRDLLRAATKHADRAWRTLVALRRDVQITGSRIRRRIISRDLGSGGSGAAAVQRHYLSA